MDYQAINEDFCEIENNIKKKLNSVNRQNPLESTVPTIVNGVFSLTKKYLPETYLLSIALLIDDIFKITFPEGENSNLWNTYSFYKKGSIGKACEQALESGIKVFGSQNKIDLISKKNLTQRDIFLSSKIHSFFVCPLIINKKVIGSIQLSLDREIDNNLRNITEEYLIWLRSKIEWIVFTEFTRINSIIDNTYSLLNALENIDEYQAYHSFCVSKIAKVFGYVINTKKEYRSLIFKNENHEEIDLLKLQLAGLLHDIGKIKMWSFEKFTTELDQCKRHLHSYFSYTILNKVAISEEIAEIAGHHHERWDGKGVPFTIEQKTMNIETQIVKFADTVDSCLRERPTSYSNANESNIITKARKSFENALEMFNNVDYKAGFSQDVYSVLLAILYDINDRNIDDRFDIIFNDIRELLGINIFKKQQIKVSCEISLHNILNYHFNRLDLNKWAVIFVFECKNIEEFANKKNILCEDGIYSVSDKALKYNYFFQFSKLNENFHVGIYVENREKEYAYNFCEFIDSYFGNENNVACAFLTYNIIHNQNFPEILNSCFNKLEEVCSLMIYNSSWRLLKFDVNNNNWK